MGHSSPSCSPGLCRAASLVEDAFDGRVMKVGHSKSSLSLNFERVLKEGEPTTFTLKTTVSLNHSQSGWGDNPTVESVVLKLALEDGTKLEVRNPRRFHATRRKVHLSFVGLRTYADIETQFTVEFL